MVAILVESEMSQITHVGTEAGGDRGPGSPVAPGYQQLSLTSLESHHAAYMARYITH